MGGPSWLGIDLGGTFVKWELVADGGEHVDSGRVPTPLTGHLAVTDLVADIVTTLVGEGSEVAGVGIAVPGHVSEARDEITLLPNVPGEWRGFAVRDHLLAATGFSVVLLNDARAFALAELELGAARDAADVVFATIGTGVGGAVAVDGAVITSRRDSFGEIGHTTAVAGGERCTCGGSGCVEAYAGGASVLLRARRRGVDVAPGRNALLALAELATTDPEARKVLEEAYAAFAVGVSTVCALTGSRVVVVGGAVAGELPGYLDASRERLIERRGLLGSVEVRSAELGARAGALGAARAARRASITTDREMEYHA